METTNQITPSMKSSMLDVFQQMKRKGYSPDDIASFMYNEYGKEGLPLINELIDPYTLQFTDQGDQGGNTASGGGFLQDAIDPLKPSKPDIYSDRTGLYGYRNARDFIDTHEAPDPLYNDQPYGFSQQYQEGPNTEQNIRDAGYGYLFDQAVPQQSGLGGLLSKLFSRHR